jgi:hypothetical protein
VLIAAPPGMVEVRAVRAAQALDYPRECLEIIIARGRQPSVQRNVALRAARGEWIYFLDDDSLVDAANLRRALRFLADPGVAMIGGPNLCPPDAPAREQVFAVVLASWLAFGPSRARYAPVGSVRDSGEKELILCNLIARRAPLLELGGFNEALYPNEENALMDELQKQGRRLVYDPGLVVQRRPRRTLPAFLKMLVNYGRGRAEQFRLHPTPGSALNFVPPLFCLYLAALAAMELSGAGRWPMWVRVGLVGPLALYAGAVAVQTLVSLPANGWRRVLPALPLLVASHAAYGIGFWRGCFTKPRPPKNPAAAEVKLEVLTW